MKRRSHLYQALQKRLLRLLRDQPQFLPNLVGLEIFLRVKMCNAARKSLVVSGHLRSGANSPLFPPVCHASRHVEYGSLLPLSAARACPGALQPPTTLMTSVARGPASRKPQIDPGIFSRNRLFLNLLPEVVRRCGNSSLFF